MTRIANTDQILALVRSQLQRMSRQSRRGSAEKVKGKDPHRLSSSERLAALKQIEDLSDDDFARGLVRSLLTEELGEKVSNSAGFFHLVDRTTAILQGDAQTAALLRRIRSDL